MMAKQWGGGEAAPVVGGRLLVHPAGIIQVPGLLIMSTTAWRRL